VKSLPPASPPAAEASNGLPDAASLAALRAWLEGLPAREAVVRYLGHHKADGQSARSMLSDIRRQLAALARRLHREDLAELFLATTRPEPGKARAVARAIEQLRVIPEPAPRVTDPVERWLEARAARALQAHGLRTLADLAVRLPRARRWWSAIPGLGAAGARRIEAFFAAHPQLTAGARALVAQDPAQVLAPWERLQVPEAFDGSQGQFRAPRSSCVLKASNDYEAVQAWLSLHEAAATQRAYRKEAERLILWAIVERGRALSSLTTEDAIAYRAFLRHPAPQRRWVGTPRPRNSPDWRPFAGPLTPRSVAYALSVLGALFRWLIEQRYVLANPFAGIKVRGAGRAEALATQHVFGEGEWALVRAVSEGLEWRYGWEVASAQRLRFLLDFAYATGLRASELVGATLGQIETDAHGEHWLRLVGKGRKPGKVALPPLARSALDRYLSQRGLPTTPALWKPQTPLLASLNQDGRAGISAARLWAVMKRFFGMAAAALEADAPALAEKLRQASPHWTRHTHATHALARGAELTTVRDNLRHASLSTTSIYLHGEDVKRARQIGNAFKAR